MISRATLVNTAPRLASLAPFWRLIVDHLECPDIGREYIRTRMTEPLWRPAQGPRSSTQTVAPLNEDRIADDQQERRSPPPSERRIGRPRGCGQDDARRTAPVQVRRGRTRRQGR